MNLECLKTPQSQGNRCVQIQFDPLAVQGEIQNSPILNSESSSQSIYEDDVLSSGQTNKNAILNTTADQPASDLEEQKQNREDEYKTTGLQIQKVDKPKQQTICFTRPKLPVLKPLPLVANGGSVKYDIKDGWKPKSEEVSGAPIPLYYDYDQFKIPIDPQTLKPFVPLYFGPRIFNSLKLHKQYAAKDDFLLQPGKVYDCGSHLQPSYSFKFPKIFSKQVREEAERKFTGMNPELDLSDELIFDSDFESGNLDLVTKVGQNEYDLYMRVDTNTRGHHQWFYFTVNYPPSLNKQTIQFTVQNFTKDSALYEQGMRIAIAKKSQGFNWFKAGDEIKYGKSNLVRRKHQDPAMIQYYYSLKFKYTFKSKALTDTVCFAYCYPYTLTKLQRFLKEVSQQQKDYYSEKVLCKSLSGVEVPELTITSRLKNDPKQFNLIKHSEFDDPDSCLSIPLYKRKKYVIISSRVHPGESNSSYMMQGLIKYLLSDSHQAKQLRKRVVFKIIPMSNPDGVIAGNYRTSMSGHDLNRRYHEPDPRLHPTVCAIKQMTNDLVFPENGEPEEIIAFIDMHGHSRNKNTFIYGPQIPIHLQQYYKMRMIPKLIGDETTKFRYFSCKFRHEKSKLKAARIVMYKQFNIFNCYTYECSLHGYFDENGENHEFTPQTYEEMGKHLANSLHEYLMILEEEDRRLRLKKLEKNKKQKKKQKQEWQVAQPKSETKTNQASSAEVRAVENDQLKNKKQPEFLSLKDKSQLVLNSEKKKKRKVQVQSNVLQSPLVERELEPKKQFDLKRQQNPNEPPSSGQPSNVEDRDSQLSLGTKSRGFRTLKDIFKLIKQQETLIPKKDPEDEAEASSESDCGADHDDLSSEQQKKLQNNIFDALADFTAANNIKQPDYLGFTSNRKTKIVKNKFKVPAYDLREQAKEESKQPFVVQTKKNPVVQPSTNMNYQNNTLSIQQKRRSFNAEVNSIAQQSLILQGASQLVSNDVRNLQIQENNALNNSKQYVNQLSNIVFGFVPSKDYSPMSNPQFLFNAEVIRQFNLQKQQNGSAIYQTTCESKANLDGTYFQQNYLQPMNFTFLNNKPEILPEQITQITQGAALRGNKLVKGKEKVNPQVEALNKVRQRYEKQQQRLFKQYQQAKSDVRSFASDTTKVDNHIRQISRISKVSENSDEDRKIYDKNDSPNAKKVGIQFQKSVLSPQFQSPQKQRISREGSDELQTEQVNPTQRHRDNLQRTSYIPSYIQEKIQSKLPSVTSTDRRPSFPINSKGHSDMNVLNTSNLVLINPNQTRENRAQQIGYHLANVNTDPLFRDVFINHLLQSQPQTLYQSPVRTVPELNQTSQQLNLSLKKSSQPSSQEQRKTQNYTDRRKNNQKQLGAILNGDYFGAQVVLSSDKEYGRENLREKNSELLKASVEFPSVYSISTKTNHQICSSNIEKRKLSQTDRVIQCDDEQLDSRFSQGQKFLNQQIQVNVDFLPVKVLPRENVKSQFSQNATFKSCNSLSSDQQSKVNLDRVKLQKLNQTITKPHQIFCESPNATNRNEIMYENDALKNALKPKNFSTMKMPQYEKYQSYAKTKHGLTSPISPRSQSPIDKTIIEDERQQKDFKANIKQNLVNANVSIKTQYMQRATQGSMPRQLLFEEQVNKPRHDDSILKKKTRNNEQSILQEETQLLGFLKQAAAAHKLKKKQTLQSADSRLKQQGKPNLESANLRTAEQAPHNNKR